MYYTPRQEPTAMPEPHDITIHVADHLYNVESVPCRFASVEAGSLCLYSEFSQPVAFYAPGEWKRAYRHGVEINRPDDQQDSE